MLRLKNLWFKGKDQFKALRRSRPLAPRTAFIVGAASFALGSAFTSLLASAEEPDQKNTTSDQVLTRRRSEKTVKLRDNEVDYFDYVIIGGGTAAFSALSELKANNVEGTIAIVSNESSVPYDRPLLSKDLWFGAPDVGQTLLFKKPDNEYESIKYEQDPAFWDGQVYTFLNTQLLDIEASKKFLLLSDNSIISYGKCLIATGSQPLPLAVPHPDTQSITTFSNVQDFQHLEKLVRDPSIKHITVVGGSQQAPEIAAGVFHRGKSTNTKVALINPSAGIFSQYLPDYLSNALNQKMKNCMDLLVLIGVDGIDLRNNVSVVSVDDDLTVHLSNGESFKTDHVVLSLGYAPNIGYAAKSGLEIDQHNHGIVANPQLKVVSGLWAAGDIVSYHDRVAGRQRLAHHEHAYYSGKVAARNMIGKGQFYYTRPQSGGKLLNDEYVTVGEIDSSLEMVGVWMKGPTENSNVYEKEENYAQGIVYYMREQKIAGVLLWNFLDEHIHDGAWQALSLAERVYVTPADVVRAIPFEPKVKEEKALEDLLDD